MKKSIALLSTLLCIMICFVSCGKPNDPQDSSATASSNTKATESSNNLYLSDFRFFKEDGYAVLINYVGDDVDVIIPSEFDGLPVTEINSHAFVGQQHIVSVICPDSITLVEKEAFENCKNLKTVDLGNSVTTIEENAFHSCSNLTNIQLGNSIHTVEAFAFCQTGLTELFIPKTITDMKNCAFAQNVSLTSLEFEDGLETIGRAAFSFSLALESVTIPASVNEIKEYAFSGCKSLKSATFLGNAPATLEEHIFKNASKDFVIYYHEGTTGWDNPALADYTLCAIQ